MKRKETISASPRKGGNSVIAVMLLAIAIVADSAVASDIKTVDVDGGGRTSALLVKAGETTRPSGIPEDISGIAMDKDGSFWAVCDSRGELCRLVVDIDLDNGKIKKCSLSEIRHVSGGKDMEGIAYDPLRDSLWICDEKGPRIFEYSFNERKTGEEISLPENLRKCMKNRSLEALEVSPDGLVLLTCNENAIPGDAIPGMANSVPVRMTKFTRKNAADPWKFHSQRYYLPEPPRGNVRNSKCRNGVASVCVDSQGRIFVLERESDKTEGAHFRIRVFEVLSPIEAGSGSSGLLPVLEKRLVYEEDTGMSMYEGMCLGPLLKNGSQTFVLVSDGDSKASESIMTLVFVKPGFAKPQRASR